MQAKNFGKFLRKLRKERGLTIRQVETYSGVSNAYLSQVETGKRGIPSPEILEKLAPVLKVSYELLMEKAGYLKSSNGNNDSTPTPEQRIAEALADDPALLEFFQELTKRDDLQLLFKQIKPLSPDSIKRVIRYIKMVEEEEASRQ